MTDSPGATATNAANSRIRSRPYSWKITSGKVLRDQDEKAQLAHLAHSHTLSAPMQVTPAQGVFLEYAPINRRYDIPYAQQTGLAQPDGLHMLDANLEVFRAETAQVLEYWLEMSRSPSGDGRQSNSLGTGRSLGPTWTPMAHGAFAISRRLRRGSMLIT